jgi:hypothetical protein
VPVAAKLALFTGALVLAVVTGWGLGLLVGPVSLLPDPASPPAVTFEDHAHTPTAGTGRQQP